MSNTRPPFIILAVSYIHTYLYGKAKKKKRQQTSYISIVGWRTLQRISTSRAASQADSQFNREEDREEDRQTRQTGRQTGNRRTDRQAGRQSQTNTFGNFA